VWGVFFLSLCDDPCEKINGSERRGKGLRKRRDLGEYYRGSHSVEKVLSDCEMKHRWSVLSSTGGGHGKIIV